MDNSILSDVSKAIRHYGMIEPGDKVLAAVSGGKDSLTMLNILNTLSHKKASRFELVAAHIRTDFHCSSCMHRELLTEIFAGMGITCFFREIKVLDKQRQTNCFWCSWNRRKALFTLAGQLGINKIAFGHHKDDIIETSLLNLFFQGEISAMRPRQELFGGKIVIIRPLCFVEEGKIRLFAQEHNFPSKLCRCPFGAVSKRRLIKGLINDLAISPSGCQVRDNLFKSFCRINAGANLKQDLKEQAGICI